MPFCTQIDTIYLPRQARDTRIGKSSQQERCFPAGFQFQQRAVSYRDAHRLGLFPGGDTYCRFRCGVIIVIDRAGFVATVSEWHDRGDSLRADQRPGILLRGDDGTAAPTAAAADIVWCRPQLHG